MRIPSRPIVVATRNPGKFREISAVLSDLPVEALSLEGFEHVPEPEETGAKFCENARDKAAYYARHTGQWCLADDSGLEVDYLGGEPGVYSARYAADECPASAGRAVVDPANNAKLLRKLRGVPDPQRAARFVCCLALSDGERILLEVRDTIEGRIGHEERGENGFGYDPLFYVPDLHCTTAELPPERKNTVSHRGKAVRRFAAELAKLLGNGG